MERNIKSIRAFIGAFNFDESRNFYRDFGFKENSVSPNMSYFEISGFGFYLQDAAVKDWVDNSMLFLEVDDLSKYHDFIKKKELEKNFKKVRVSDIQYNDWGNEFFVHDPSGILWHIGTFTS